MTMERWEREREKLEARMGRLRVLGEKRKAFLVERRIVELELRIRRLKEEPA